MSRRSRQRRPSVAAPSPAHPVIVVDRCDDCGQARGACTCDPTAGRVGHDAGAKARCRARPWHWLPGADGPEIGVRDIHGRGWTTAHTGTIANPREAEEEREARLARLTPEEREVFALRAAKVPHVEIAAQLGVSLRVVERRVETMRRKLRELAEAAGAMGGPR